MGVCSLCLCLGLSLFVCPSSKLVFVCSGAQYSNPDDWKQRQAAKDVSAAGLSNAGWADDTDSPAPARAQQGSGTGRNEPPSVLSRKASSPVTEDFDLDTEVAVNGGGGRRPWMSPPHLDTGAGVGGGGGGGGAGPGTGVASPPRTVSLHINSKPVQPTANAAELEEMQAAAMAAAADFSGAARRSDFQEFAYNCLVTRRWWKVLRLELVSIAHRYTTMHYVAEFEKARIRGADPLSVLPKSSVHLRAVVLDMKAAGLLGAGRSSVEKFASATTHAPKAAAKTGLPPLSVMERVTEVFAEHITGCEDELLMPFGGLLTALVQWRLGASCLPTQDRLDREIALKFWHRSALVSNVQALARGWLARRRISARRLRPPPAVAHSLASSTSSHASMPVSPQLVPGSVARPSPPTMLFGAGSSPPTSPSSVPFRSTTHPSQQGEAGSSRRLSGSQRSGSQRSSSARSSAASSPHRAADVWHRPDDGVEGGDAGAGLNNRTLVAL